MIYHPDPAEFIANSGDYGALGKTLVALSNLEFAHDKFVFKMHETNYDLSVSISRQFPQQFIEKTNFLIRAVSHVQKLRQVPIFQTGELNLLWLQYQLDELYGIRNIVAHGSVFYTESTPTRITWTFERFVQEKEKEKIRGLPKNKRPWKREEVKISDGYLASVYYSASILEDYFVRLIHRLEDYSCWESEYQSDKEMRQGRMFFAELAANGIIVDDNRMLNAFPPLFPVE